MWNDNGWFLDFTYLRDDGTIGTFQAWAAGSSIYQAPSHPGSGGLPVPLTPFWASPTATISISAAPGASGGNLPILLACPPIVQWAAFGSKVPGFPFASGGNQF